jgi:aerobic carbon-monoxide dehydrogenase large subunit
MIPTAYEVPSYEMYHLQTPSPFNSLGVKGMGEGGTVPPPAALAIAVSDALSPFDVEVKETPITPEKVMRLLRSSKAYASRS